MGPVSAPTCKCGAPAVGHVTSRADGGVTYQSRDYCADHPPPGAEWVTREQRAAHETVERLAAEWGPAVVSGKSTMRPALFAAWLDGARFGEGEANL